ncbi:MAG: M1 family metallopeptidase [Balneolales bacterium]
MKIKSLLFTACCVTLIVAESGIAQNSPSNHEAFQPLTMPSSTPFRTGSGVPGPNYWQNDVNYLLEVSLDDQDHEISGSVTIDYTNNSPDDFPFLWLMLDQNLFHSESRGSKATPLTGSRFGSHGFDGGMAISNVTVEHDGATYEPDYVITDTRMQLRLDDELKAKGGDITVSMDYEYIIPLNGSDRTGRLETENGWLYTIAQWYPRMAVYDDVSGWNTRPYLGAGEFYADHGDFEMKITVPHDHILVASGELLNPDEVLTRKQRNRLRKAEKSEETKYIISPEEIGKSSNRPQSSGNLTWHYKMENTRDVAWASSKSFIWDASGAEMPSGKTVLAMSVYPIESDGDHAWGRSTEYTRASIMHYSEKWLEYPYPTAINVAGMVYGMEYPSVSFCSWEAEGAGLWGVTDHEFGHNWFPMIVGTNERMYMWMDEGMNTFLNHYSTLAFNDGEYPPRFNSARYLAPMLNVDNLEPIMTHPEQISEQNLGLVGYFKPAAGLILLREEILTPERFDYALQSYIEEWAYKKPTPMDFFRFMNNATGENLDWFWRGWFYETWVLDQSVEEVEYATDDTEDGTLITIANNENLVMPVVVEVTDANDNVERYELPVGIWHRVNEWTLEHNSTSEVIKVEIDPDKRLPDVNPGNNVWEKSAP